MLQSDKLKGQNSIKIAPIYKLIAFYALSLSLSLSYTPSHTLTHAHT